jgi:uncharacterized tellurite resistance protein B-like protein
MGISDLYLGIEQRRNVSHFANIVKIAVSDHEVSQEEVVFLQKVSKKYNISDEDFKLILRDPDKIPTIAHLDCIERIERLYDLMTMIRADHHIENEEVTVLRKIVTGLAFPVDKVDEIVDKSVEMNLDEISMDDFVKRIFVMLNLKYKP